MSEKAILVTVNFDSIRRDFDIQDLSEELEELSKSAGLTVFKNLIFTQKTPNAALFVGRGKVEELAESVKKEKVDVVVFEGNLTSTQQRNLEEMIQTKTIDRTQLILDLFAQRAKSVEGKLQVELAQMKYLLPKLAGKGIYLSRLGGGVGTRGPGEQKLEVDRRRIRERIARRTRELGQIEKRRLSNIQKKKDKDLPLVTLVGYTNAGKSSLFNASTNAAVIVKDKLFSTLDTTTRLLALPRNQKALLADTVGFVRELPHHLIESFKATLEEAVHADILLHVIDASRPDMEALERAVQQVLRDLGADKKKVILVLNKIDLLDKKGRENLSKDPHWRNGIMVSSLTGEGLNGLWQCLVGSISNRVIRREFFVPKEKLGLVHFLYEEAEVLSRRDEAEGAFLSVNLSLKTEEFFKLKLIKAGTA